MDGSARSECLPGTRVDLLNSITHWVYFRPEQRVLWLHGLAGSGKSTIATTVANLFRRQNRLGAFLFFNRDVAELSQPGNVIRTLAYWLGSFDPHIGTAITAVMERIPSIVQSPIQFQFGKLLLEPLTQVPPAKFPLVLVLDALDECGTAQERIHLLAVLAAESVNLPAYIRIIITSRAESDIRRAFAPQQHVLTHKLDLAPTKDILSFVQHRMAHIRSANSLLLEIHWPGDQAIEALVRRAAGLFIWAATACRFIDGHDPRRRLNLLLRGDINGNTELALDALYKTALRSIGMWDDEDFVADFRTIMGAILVAKNPLSASAIDSLLCLDRPSSLTISRMGCLLNWQESQPIRILHPSFSDFLSDNLRCGTDSWHIDTKIYNQHFSMRCVRYLNNTLTKNICQLALGTAEVRVNLPEALSYAAKSWISHICMMGCADEAVADELEEFLFRHLLHWLEVMSILKQSRTTIASMRHFLEWLQVHILTLMTLCC